MVDWGPGGRGGELCVAGMHAADRHRRPDTRLPPTAAAANMSQEDEVELNVMDFVETEYKSDMCDGAEQGRKRKKARPRAPGPRGKAGNARKPKQNTKGPGEGGRPAHKHKKRKHGNKQTDKNNAAEFYPYATILKNLCDKVGGPQGSTEALPRIFSQLRHSDVHYPYASLLQALHRHAGGARRAGPSRPGPSLEVARVMRNIRYPTSTRPEAEEDSDSPSMLFSTLLMMTVMQQKVHSHSSSLTSPAGPGRDLAGIGAILRKEMPHSQRDDPPPSELSSASLLQKLSLSAERDLGASGNKRCPAGAQQGTVWYSSDSSQSGADDLDWRPTHWLARKVSKASSEPAKRKSGRKKKSPSWDPEPEQPNTSQDRGAGAAGRGRNQRGTASESARAKLLQFIMGRRQAASPEKKSRKALKRSKVTKKRGKRKHPDDAQQPAPPTPPTTTIWITELPADGLAEGRAAPVGRAGGRRAAMEPQSLLKEYLLKPAGEEVVGGDSCDIPKLESNFLFSRLLQNFKNLAESCQPDDASERTAEPRRGPSILRGMLATGAGGDPPQDPLFLGDHQSASLATLGQQPGEEEPLLRVKQEIKVEVEDVVCKVECEEDGFECQVCHLQFSSLTDLSNHQVLFHCAEDPPTPTGTHRLLGCGVEGLAGGVMQGKQPA